MQLPSVAPKYRPKKALGRGGCSISDAEMSEGPASVVAVGEGTPLTELSGY